MRFIHISDTHIGPDESFMIFGSNPYHKLALTIDHLNNIPVDYDFIVHTGDIVEVATESSYLLAANLFKKLRKPIYFIPGNHDNANLVKVHLSFNSAAYIHEETDNSFLLNKGKYQLLFIDAPTPSENPYRGKIEDSTIRSIERYILKKNKQTLIFIHYPPLPLDSKWLNNDMLLINGKELHDLLKGPEKNVLAVFFGHVHRGMQVIKDKLTYISTGSPFCQFQAWPDSPEPEFVINEPSYYNIVTVDGDQLTIRNQAIPL